MDHGPWYEIRHQRERVIDSPPTGLGEFQNGIRTSGDYFSDIFQDSNENSESTIPLSYYTKACAWASDYPFMYRRVMVYLNPYHLDGEKELDPYLRREFGCDKETFVDMVSSPNHWIVILLDRPVKYNRHVHEEIEDLFKDINDRDPTVRPRYVNLVDVALGAKLAKDGGKKGEYIRNEEPPYMGDYVDIDATIADWMEDEDRPWKTLDTCEIDDVYGVNHHSNLRYYVTERAAKLQLAGETIGGELSDDGDTDPGTIVDTMRDRIGDVERAELVRQTYSDWNHVGTPIFYCDFSGAVDVGPDPYAEYVGGVFDRFTEIANKVKSQVEIVQVELKQKTGMMNNLRIPDFDEVKTNRVFGVSPEGDVANSSKRLRRRTDTLGEYYNRFDSEILGPFKFDEVDSREELRKQADIAVNNAFTTGSESSSLTAKLVKSSAYLTGSSTISFAAGFVTPELAGPITGASAATALVGTILDYKGNLPADKGTYKRVPQPVATNLDLGRLNRWTVPYDSDGHDVAADGGVDGGLTYIADVAVV